MHVPMCRKSSIGCARARRASDLRGASAQLVVVTTYNDSSMSVKRDV